MSDRFCALCPLLTANLTELRNLNKSLSIHWSVCLFSLSVCLSIYLYIYWFLYLRDRATNQIKSLLVSHFSFVLNFVPATMNNGALMVINNLIFSASVTTTQLNNQKHAYIEVFKSSMLFSKENGCTSSCVTITTLASTVNRRQVCCLGYRVTAFREQRTRVSWGGLRFTH